MGFNIKLFTILTLIVVLLLTRMTSIVSIIDAQSLVIPEEKPIISSTESTEKEIPSDET
jgi:uncharacterized protein